MKLLRLAFVGMMLVVAVLAATRAVPVYAEQPAATGKMAAGHHCQDCPDCDDTSGGGCEMACAVACSSFIAADFTFVPALTYLPVETFSVAQAPLLSLSRPPPLQPPIL